MILEKAYAKFVKIVYNYSNYDYENLNHGRYRLVITHLTSLKVSFVVHANY